MPTYHINYDSTKDIIYSGRTASIFKIQSKMIKMTTPRNIALSTLSTYAPFNSGSPLTTASVNIAAAILLLLLGM